MVPIMPSPLEGAGRVKGTKKNNRIESFLLRGDALKKGPLS